MALRETDILTGLHTPGYMIAFGARELECARRNGYPVSLITIDLGAPEDPGSEAAPDFSSDTARKLGDLIRRIAGDGSVIARLNGNEIAVLLPGVEADKASRIGAQISQGIRSTAQQGLLASKAPICIGVASTSGELKEFEELIHASRVSLAQSAFS